MSIKESVKDFAGTAFATILAAVHGRQPPLSDMRRFVVLQYPSALGSAVHATPLLPALRAAVPDAEIVVCASGFSLDILRENPTVDRLIETPNPRKEFWPSVRALRTAFSSDRPFATIASAASPQTSIALAAALAGARNFVGFTLLPKIFRKTLTYDAGRSLIANNLRIVEALGHAPAKWFEPQVFFSAEDLAHARALVNRFADPSRPIAAIVSQTNPAQRKSWRPERFTAASKALIDRHGFNLVFPGAASERANTEVFAQQFGGRAQSVAGETTLRQLAALLSLCSVGLTLDTGILHVGRAVGLPMVVIAPAWSPPLEWLPLENPRYIILKNLDLPACPPDYIIDEVPVDDAVSALERLIEHARATPKPEHLAT